VPEPVAYLFDLSHRTETEWHELVSRNDPTIILNNNEDARHLDDPTADAWTGCVQIRNIRPLTEASADEIDSTAATPTTQD